MYLDNLLLYKSKSQACVDKVYHLKAIIKYNVSKQQLSCMNLCQNLTSPGLMYTGPKQFYAILFHLSGWILDKILQHNKRKLFQHNRKSMEMMKVTKI